MWYAISVDDGIIHKASTKKEILSRGYKTAKKYNKGDYEIIGTCDDQESSCKLYLYDSKDRAIENGFAWAFNKEGEK